MKKTRKEPYLFAAAVLAALCLAAGGALAQGKKGRPEKPALQQPQMSLPTAEMLKIETEMDARRDNEIETVKKLIKLGPTEDEKPKLVFRIAELFGEKAKFHWFQAMAIADEIPKEKDPGRQRTLKASHDDHQKKSVNFRRQAMEYYKVILDKYKNYPRVDEVLFYYGYNLMESQQQAEALKMYRRLITEFPDSTYVPDAYLAFGEYYFSKGELERAIEAYKRVTRFEKSRVYGFALYKMGWVYYNLAEWEKALDMFSKVIAYSNTQADENKENKITLRREATKDFVMAYSMLDNITNVKDVFLEVGGQENYPKMIDSLANLLFDQGKDKQALIVFNIIIKENPDSIKAPLYQAKRVECYHRMGDKRKTVEETRRLVEVLQSFEKTVPKKDDPKCQDPNEAEKCKERRKAFNEAKKLSETKIRELATLYHNEAKKTGAEATYSMAHELYGDYLTLFPKSKDAYTMRFYYAELLYKLAKWERAGDEYAKIYAEDPKGKFAKDAAHSTVLAYKEASKKEPAPKDRSNREIPLSKMMEKRVRACTLYTQNFPKADDAVDVKYEVGEIMYKYNHFKEANRVFAEIALNYPDNKLAEYSVNLILDSFNLAQNWADLNTWSRKFLENPKLAKGRVKEDLKRLVAESAFKMIEDFEKQGKFEVAAEKYLAFVKEFPDSKMADQAVYNAAANYDKAKNIKAALDTKLLMIQKYPDSKHAPTVLWSVAEQYRNRADFLNAAKYYEMFAEKYEKDKNAPMALFNAGVYRFGLEQYTESLDDREKYLKKFPKERDAAEVYLGNAAIYEKLKEWKKASEIYRDFQKKYPQDSGRVLLTMVKQGLILRKLKDVKESNKVLAKAVEFHKGLAKKGAKVDPATLEGVAHARFLLVTDTFRQYDAIKLDLDEKLFQKRRAEKDKAMEKVYAAYTEVVNYKVAEWAIASLYKVGKAYEAYVNAILKIPLPKNLKTNEQKELYKQELKVLTMPVEDKAVAAYQASLAKSAEFGIYNKWSVRSLKKLVKMRPLEYAIGAERKVTPDYFGEDVEPNGMALSLNWEKKMADEVEQRKLAPPPPPAPPKGAPPPAKEEGTKDEGAKEGASIKAAPGEAKAEEADDKGAKGEKGGKGAKGKKGKKGEKAAEAKPADEAKPEGAADAMPGMEEKPAAPAKGQHKMEDEDE
ncbi:MAG: tetratricopeptide repeat protein [Deltaproteobacteria bacterium]|nr:tetratricopeptide repeat protein [Deltaproteobacteria bacterium]